MHLARRALCRTRHDVIHCAANTLTLRKTIQFIRPTPKVRSLCIHIKPAERLSRNDGHNIEQFWASIKKLTIDPFSLI